MNNSLSAKERKTGTKSGLASLLYGFITGTSVMALCILVIPLLLLKSDTPEKYISVAAFFTVSVTALAASFAASANCGRSFILTGISCSLVIILILVCASLAFGSETQERNYLFSGILYLASLVFSLIGAKLACGKGRKKRTSRKRH